MHVYVLRNMTLCNVHDNVYTYMHLCYACEELSLCNQATAVAQAETWQIAYMPILSWQEKPDLQGAVVSAAELCCMFVLTWQEHP